MDSIIWLEIYLLFLLFAWLPLSHAKYRSFGVKYLASNRGKTKEQISEFGGRAQRAYDNLKDYAVPFVGAVLVLQLKQATSTLIQYSIAIYVVCRMGHFISYLVGNVTLRASFWFIALVCNLILIFSAF